MKAQIQFVILICIIKSREKFEIEISGCKYLSWVYHNIDIF